MTGSRYCGIGANVQYRRGYQRSVNCGFSFKKWLTMYDVGDILLFALSGRRQTGWGTFKRCFDEVYRRSTPVRQGVSDNNMASHRNLVLRTLSCLGHIDWHSDKGEIAVVVAPPTIALLPILLSCRAILGHLAPLET